MQNDIEFATNIGINKNSQDKYERNKSIYIPITTYNFFMHFCRYINERTL